jgi:hypothetical protein
MSTGSFPHMNNQIYNVINTIKLAPLDILAPLPAIK